MINIKIFKYSSIIFSILLIGCATVPHEETATGIAESYIGQSFETTFLEYGPPTAAFSDGKDGTILHWDRSTTHATPALSYTSSQWGDLIYGDATAMTVSAPPSTTTTERFIQFFIDSEGTIYHYRIQNVQTEAEHRAERINGNVKSWSVVIGVPAAILLVLYAAGA